MPKKPPKKLPAKKAKSASLARTRARAREAEPVPAPKLTRAERREANRRAHAERQAAIEAERAAKREAKESAMPPPETIISVEPVQPEPDPSPAEEEPVEARLLRETREVYRPDYAPIAQKLTELGATRSDLAEAFGVHPTSIRQWGLRHPEFAEALRLGDEHVVRVCEARQFELANGFAHEVTKIVNGPDGPTRVKYVEAHPPSLPAIRAILHNRAPDRWKPDSQVAKIEMSGSIGAGPAPGEEPDAERQRLELARKVGFMLGSALAKLQKSGGDTDGLTIPGTARDITPKPREMTRDGITALTVSTAVDAQEAERRRIFEQRKAEAVARIRAQFPHKPKEPTNDRQ